MAIIQTIKSGNCTIYIDDTYCKNNTEEDNKRIRERIGEIYYKAWLTGKLKDSPNKQCCKGLLIENQSKEEKEKF